MNQLFKENLNSSKISGIIKSSSRYRLYRMSEIKNLTINGIWKKFHNNRPILDNWAFENPNLGIELAVLHNLSEIYERLIRDYMISYPFAIVECSRLNYTDFALLILEHYSSDIDGRIANEALTNCIKTGNVSIIEELLRKRLINQEDIEKNFPLSSFAKSVVFIKWLMKKNYISGDFLRDNFQEILENAFEVGDQAVITYFLEIYENISQKKPIDWNRCYIRTWANQFYNKNIQEFLAKRVDLKELTKSEYFQLQAICAFRGGNIENINAIINYFSKNRLQLPSTALIEAINAGHLGIILKYLQVANGLTPEAIRNDLQFYTLLMQAAVTQENGLILIIPLVKAGFKIEKIYISLAINNGRNEIAKYLSDHLS